MSKLITKSQMEEYESQEEKWLEDEGEFDEFWEKKLQDEEEYFTWLRERFEKTANHFSGLSNLNGVFYEKLMHMLMEASMTGFFFGELRWNNDIRDMIESALEDEAPRE